jgi:hypothetical protein
MTQTVFTRYEKKYMLDRAQYESLTECFAGRMEADGYGAYTVSNLYYDTDNFDLIRASMEKPLYKEKLRLRCYGTADADTPVFLELKKKYKGVVYKRRAKLAYHEAKDMLERGAPSAGDNRQVLREIAFFLMLYPVSAKLLLCYDRTALRQAGADAGDLRITFDTDIRFRREDPRLDGDLHGAPVLERDKVLMEVKTSGAIPLWLCQSFSDLGIFPTSFSKYGTCYREYIAKEKRLDREVNIHA